MKSEGMLQYVRLTNNGKLSDRYVTTQVKEPAEPDERERGRIFAVVEIENPWFPTSQIGQTIINTVSREYFRGSGEDILADFELALKKVNDTLHHLAQTGETDWVGKLNAALALTVGDELHLSSVGNVHGWLVRGGKATRAIESHVAPSPSKTFGSVLSGSLEAGDRLVIASSGLSTLVSTEELNANVFTAKDLNTAAFRLAGLLRAKRGQWINAVLIEHPDPANHQADPLLRSTLYLDTGNVNDWKLTLSGALSGAHQAVLRAGAALAKANRKTDDFVRTRILPSGKKALEESQGWTKQTWTKLKDTTLPGLNGQAAAIGRSLKQSVSHGSSTQDSTRGIEQENNPVVPQATDGQPHEDSLIGKALYTIRDYHDGRPANPTADSGSTHAKRAKKPSLPQLNLGQLATQLTGIQHKVARAPFWRSRSLGFGILAAALGVLLILNLRAISVRHSEAQSREQAQATLTQLKDQLEEAKLAKIFNQPDKASESLRAVLSGLETLTDTPVASDAALVYDEAQQQLDSLTNTNRLETLVELATIPDGKQLTLWDNQLTTTTPTGLSTVTSNGGEVAQIALPDIQATAPHDEQEQLIVLTEDPTLYAVEAATESTSPLMPKGGGLKTGTALEVFFGNLYILSPADNQIWKYETSSGALQDATNYISDGSQLSNAIDLAIDGSVYVLNEAGEILKFNRGKRAEFSVRDIPATNSTLTSPKQILTTRDGNTLYVLDADRVVALDKTGRFQAQYAFKGITDVKSIALDEPNKTFYVLAGNKLYKTPF